MQTIHKFMDVLFEILVRVDPPCIFDCILVSKDWLQVIAGPIFRRTYLKRWEKSPKLLLGFFVLEYVFMNNRPTGIQLLPATKLGKIMNARKSSLNPSLGCFVSKSSENGFILSVVRPNTFYVSDPITATGRLPNNAVRLPPVLAPEIYKNAFMANILSDDPLKPSSFKVILAEANTHSIHPQKDTLIIHIFRSSTGKWEKSMLTCSTHFGLFPVTKIDTGTVAKGGIIYWPARRDRSSCIAVYDTNADDRISLIAAPEDANYGINTHYCVSPENSLRCAIRRADTYVDEKAWELGRIDIWSFEDDKKFWKMLYSESLDSIWTENLDVLMPRFKVRPLRPFGFVSFVPGRSDSIVFGLEKQLFIFRFHGRKLERICVGGFDDRLKICSRFEYGAGFRPLTMPDLGIWPSSPASLNIPLY